MPSIIEKAIMVGIYLLINLTTLAFAAESPLRTFLAEWKNDSVRRSTLLDLGGVTGLSTMVILFSVLVAISQ
ncbi:hypothetical protein MYX78_06120 [Acidobacteria bacterium AH-259-G07]|nr:hypothetical protein [Acidobacteria bacterium AH-259-G07]